jgi:hypothetical protein
MQDRYVADVGNFGKYELLRNIAKTNLIIGINWYLTPTTACLCSTRLL